MKVTLAQSQLVTVLKRVAPAVVSGEGGYRSCVLLTAGDGELTVGATNHLLDIVARVPALFDEKTPIVLPHRRLLSLATELPPGRVELTVDSKLRVTIKSLESKRKFTMTGLDATDFPKIVTETTGSPILAVPSKTFQSCAGEISFLIDPGYTDGVLLSAEKQTGITHAFSLTSLTGRGIAWSVGSAASEVAKEPCLLPRILLEALKSVPADERTLTFHLNDPKITVRAGDDTLISTSLILKPFPPGWREYVFDALPKPSDRRFTVSSEALLAGARAVALAAEATEGPDRFVQLTLRYSGSVCTLHTKESEKSAGEDEVAVSNESDTAGHERSFVVHLNGERFMAAVRAFLPVELDFYFEVFQGSEAVFLRTETLLVVLLPILVVEKK